MVAVLDSCEALLLDLPMEILDELQEKVIIERTAGANDDYLFTHAVIRLNESLTFEAYSGLKERVDFISMEKEGVIDFLHVSKPEFEESIIKKGLLVNREYIADLGRGIYLINVCQQEAWTNLENYVISSICGSETDYLDEVDLDLLSEVELLIITGKYNGRYNICVDGWGHEGYVVVKNTIEPDILDIEMVNARHFVENY